MLKRSWIDSANDAEGEFPLNNLPCGVFSTRGLPPRCGVAIGDMILDAARAEEAGLTGTQRLLQSAKWNPLMAEGPAVWSSLRKRLTDLLAEGAPDRAAVEPLLVPMADATMHMPLEVAEYTDFYAGKQHAQNVGTMFRGPENALPPNWLHIPIGYNGRASTVVVSGTGIRRPLGQTKAKDAEMPSFGPSKRLDIELEIGAIVGTPSQMGEPITTDRAQQMIFGYVLLNDWSARDLQAWEYQPLGPFQAKAFATTISSWIVTREALAPFAVVTPSPEKELLPYLKGDFPGNYDVNLSIEMNGHRISTTNMRELYYSAAQQLTHHASSGCSMRTGDLLGSGTISGPGPSNYGSLLEMTWGGETPLDLGGETRTFIEDGDTLTLRGHAQGDGYRVGFGACTGTILPAPDYP
ncbi:fumarylacetoacetate hydrolase [Palleronia marisminoris]|uniref:fumarylacetoacetase n=1 Tax=Palleronia marisminoris TaxID=315423 RepID=A0A1Y5S7R7_9RHOB|nr:fumarylacetoacetase [Palleronia marisminoris]SFG67088.1 fumarylacetoacetate hydrolase [Palleronia marisminoris]SLN34270.1 Ureidoglycolate lyase [Palleronia marisminoris]